MKLKIPIYSNWIMLNSQHQLNADLLVAIKRFKHEDYYVKEN